MVTEQDLNLEMATIGKALGRNPIDYVTALSVASGVNDSGRIEICRRKIGKVLDSLREGFPKSTKGRLERILQFYNFGDWVGCEEISFVSAVDNFANPGLEQIGNCWTRSSIFYVLAHTLGLNVGLTASFLQEHSSLRTMDDNPIIIDLNYGIREKRYADETDITFVNHLGLGYLNRLDSIQSPEEKAQLCKGILILSPERPEGYSELAAVHIKYGGNPDIAVQLSRTAVELSHGHPVCKGNLVLAYDFAKRPDLACKELEKLESEYPVFEHLPKLRKIIKTHKN